jgi:hypothetical protein
VGRTHACAWTLAAGQAALDDSQRIFRNGELVGVTLPWSEAVLIGTPTRNSLGWLKVTLLDGESWSLTCNGDD